MDMAWGGVFVCVCVRVRTNRVGTLLWVVDEVSGMWGDSRRWDSVPIKFSSQGETPRKVPEVPDVLFTFRV